MSSDPESSTASEEPVATQGTESLISPRDTSTESQPPPSGARQLSAYEKFLAYERAKRGEGRGSEPPASLRAEPAGSPSETAKAPPTDETPVDQTPVDETPADQTPVEGPVHATEDGPELEVDFEPGSAAQHDIPSALTEPSLPDVGDAADDALDRPSEVLLGDALLNWKKPEAEAPVPFTPAPEDSTATSSVLLEHDDHAAPGAGDRGLFFASPLRDLRRARNRILGTRATAGVVFAVALGALAHYATREDPRGDNATAHVDSKPEAAPRPPDRKATITPPPASPQTTAPPSAVPKESLPGASENAGSEHPIAKLLRLEVQHDVGACEIAAGTPAGGPGPSEQALRVGRGALARGVPADARAPLCLAAHHNPQNFMVTAALVQAYLLLGDASHAASVAAEALLRQPKVRILAELHADALIQSAKLNEALPALLAALHLTPADASKFPTVAASYARAGKQAQRAADPAQAKRLFRRAALLDEASVPAALGLSAVLTGERTKESLAAAAGWANYAIEREPENADAQVALGDALKASGELPSAKAAYEKALALAPKHPRARARLAGL